MKKILLSSAGVCFFALMIGWMFRLWTPSHEKISPALPPHSVYLFPLTECDAHIPCLQAEIEGIPFSAKLDLGYDGVLSLPKHLIEQLMHKCDAGTALYRSIKGNIHEIPVFTIPKLYIGDLALSNLPAEESLLEFEQDTNLGPNTDFDPSDITARIGWRAFLGAIVLIDLHNSIAICCDSLETLQDEGYLLEKFASINLLPCKGLIEFEANINHRRIKCLLDTGSTLNLIHTPTDLDKEHEFAKIDLAHPLPPVELYAGKQHLGSCVFHETQLPFEIEAILGVDFFKTQIVCIDFINQKLHLYPHNLQDIHK